MALCNQLQQMEKADSNLLTVWHHLSALADGRGMDLVFSAVRKRPVPTAREAEAAAKEYLKDSACPTQTERLLDKLKDDEAWPLAYALAWISAAGTSSSISPWVLYNFPRTESIIEELRDERCGAENCPWCQDKHSAAKQLDRWFGYQFRAEPADQEGKSLQEKITQATMDHQHLLGILPTGTGKSVCYQVPALTSYDNTGGLTVVISPLVALMADQLRGLAERGITGADAINGLLTMPERSETLRRVRSGETAILLISPEQLRNSRVSDAIAQRAVATWVLDEAHCLAKWGHDFRPDYWYIARFMEKYEVTAASPTILCLTATAKPDVKKEITDYFREKLQLELKTEDGGARRPNLEFTVVPTTDAARLDHITSIIDEEHQRQPQAGIIITAPPSERPKSWPKASTNAAGQPATFTPV